MKKVLFPEKASWLELIKRPVIEQKNLEKLVQPILDAVERDGDKAVKHFTKQFDGVSIEEIKVSASAIATQSNRLDTKLKQAIEQAASNITLFHQNQQEFSKPLETSKGIRCWRKSVAIEKVGLYIPGGSAPLFSTLLMLAIPAKIAGAREIVICTPPMPSGEIADSIAYTCTLLELNTVFSIGGAQAVAAMAFGTESVPKVDKIFGPGNQYVAQAKKLIASSTQVAIDLPAGPSELLVIADNSGIPSFIAADLLSQAEHGADSQVVFVSTDETLIDRVEIELEKQLQGLARREIAEKALSNSLAVCVKSLDEAIHFSNLYAPEHLILSVDAPLALCEKVRNAGSVFLGHYTPESLGDYASGTNHTLPTNGAARSYSGVSLDSFVKKITFQESSKEGLEIISETVQTMACAEGLTAHALAVSKRLEEKQP